MKEDIEKVSFNLNLEIFSNLNSSVYKQYSWIWKLYVSDRIHCSKFYRFLDLKKLNGLYLLIEKKLNFIDIYVGQSRRNVLERIKKHNKAFSQQAKVYLFQSDQLFGDLNNLFWFENAFYQYFKNSSNTNIRLLNVSFNDYDHISFREKENQKIFAEMKKLLVFLEKKFSQLEQSILDNDSIDNNQVLITKDKVIPILDNDHIFVFEGNYRLGGDYYGKGKLSTNKKNFLVLKDSWTSKLNHQYNHVYKKLYISYQKLTKELLSQSIIIEDEEKYLFVKNYQFNSPSAAATFFKLKELNGWTEWKEFKTKGTLDSFYR